MAWCIKTGDDIKRDQKIRYSVQQNLKEDYQLSDLVFTETLTECSDV